MDGTLVWTSWTSDIVYYNLDEHDGGSVAHCRGGEGVREFRKEKKRRTISGCVGTERYQHNHRNWVPDARERLFAVVVLLIAGGRGRTVSPFRKENVDNYCSCEERY